MAYTLVRLKRQAILIINAMVPSFVIGIGIATRTPLNYLMLLFVASLLLMFLLTRMVLKTPFDPMIEGSGLMALDLNSSGIIRSYLLTLNKGLVTGKIAGDNVSDVFDRENATMQLAAPESFKDDPVNKSEYNIDDEGNMHVLIKHVIPKDEVGKARFQLQNWVTFLYNSHVGGFLTKNQLGELETDQPLLHHLLHLGKKVTGLEMALKGFGRYVADAANKERWSWVSGNFMKVIIIVILIGFIGYGIYVLLSGAGGGQMLNTIKQTVAIGG